jgi:hypothetical protein
MKRMYGCTTHWTFAIIGAASVAFCLWPAGARAIPANFVFTHANVITMDSSEVLQDRTVVVRGERIADIFPSGSKRLTRDATQVDAAGKYLMPGLVDSHVHLESAAYFLFAYQQRISVDYSKTLFPYIYNGVTTAIAMAGESDLLKLRDAIARREIEGPRLFVSALVDGDPAIAVGPQVNAIGGPAGAAALVNRLHDLGYDQLKVYSALKRDTFDALVGEAAKLNWRVAGHIPSDVGVEYTLSHGQGMVAHGEEFMKFSRTLSDADIARFTAIAVTNHTWVTPTLTTFHNIIEQIIDLNVVLANPDFKFVNPYVRFFYLPANSKYKAFMNDPAELARLRAQYSFIQKLTRSFSAARVSLLAGTDSLNPSVIGGFSLHDELDELVTAGLSTYEALRAATVAPAEYLHQSDRWGTVRVGKVADLILLRANPLENIGNTRGIEGVMVRGKWHSRRDLDTSAAALKENYAKMIETVPMLAPLR